mgnify:CR=1 FL=1
MLIGVPKEVKEHEHRVGLVPSSVCEIINMKHEVVVEKGAGASVGLFDKDYEAAGARLVDTAEEVFAEADMIIKVKEPQPFECRRLRPGQLLFTFLHLAPDPEQTRLLMESGCTAIAYETVTSDGGRLPLLAPMSEVAGRMSVQAGAHCLEKKHGGRGTLLGGVPGVLPGKVTVLGGGVVGYNAIKIAVGMGAEVTVLDKSLPRLNELDTIFGQKIRTLYSNISNIQESTSCSDLVIGAVLIPGASAPRLVTREILKDMPEGSVLVDVAIDQGGCAETSRATTHTNPTYIEEGVVHYCVTNMPGGVARTSTLALNNATLPYTLRLIDKGWKEALRADTHLRNGLNIHDGKVTYRAVAEALGYEYHPTESLI